MEGRGDVHGAAVHGERPLLRAPAVEGVLLSLHGDAHRLYLAPQPRAVIALSPSAGETVAAAESVHGVHVREHLFFGRHFVEKQFHIIPPPWDGYIYSIADNIHKFKIGKNKISMFSLPDRNYTDRVRRRRCPHKGVLQARLFKLPQSPVRHDASSNCRCPAALSGQQKTAPKGGGPEVHIGFAGELTRRRGRNPRNESRTA